MCEKNNIWFRVSSPYPAGDFLPPSVRVSRLFAPNLYSRVGPSWVTIFSALPFSTFEKAEALLGPLSAALSFVPICSFVSFVYLKRCIGIRIVFPCLDAFWFSATERRKSLATVEGRGLQLPESVSRGSGERLLRRSAARTSL